MEINKILQVNSGYTCSSRAGENEKNKDFQLNVLPKIGWSSNPVVLFFLFLLICCLTGVLYIFMKISKQLRIQLSIFFAQVRDLGAQVQDTSFEPQYQQSFDLQNFSVPASWIEGLFDLLLAAYEHH